MAALVAQLGCDDFRVREAAHGCLTKTFPYVYLLAGEKSADAERARRCKQILDNWHAVNAERLAAETIQRFGSCPWMFPYDYDDCHYLQAKKQLADGPPDYPAWRLATRLFVADLHRYRVPEGDVFKVLKLFHMEEEKWKQQNLRSSR